MKLETTSKLLESKWEVMNMLKRMIAVTLASGLVFLNIPLAFAATSLEVFSIPLTGGGVLELSGTNDIDVTLVDNEESGIADGQMEFPVTGTNFVPEGDELLRVRFKANNNNLGVENFKSVLIYTDNKSATANPRASTDNHFPAGLVRSDADATLDGDVSTPLHWVVFPTSAEAKAYNFLPYRHGVDPFPVKRDKSESIDSRIQAFVSDKSGNLKVDGSPDLQDCDADPNTPSTVFCQNFATVISGLTGVTAGLANVPKADNCAESDPRLCGNSDDPNTPAVETFPARLITSDISADDLEGDGFGEAYILLAANFNGKPAGTYTTNKLTIELVQGV
ncbi:MAG: hypothetical protein HY587_05900 [Candidatus Omnitrophica bacterium]|nr:hypothetical protein [Candidatus Omnitrophota bacterium]